MNEQLIESAVFGKQVENFLSSDLGKYLVHRAEGDADEAMESLKRVLPWRKRRIQELQNKVWLAESFQQWLADAILDGVQATNLLEDDNG